MRVPRMGFRFPRLEKDFMQLLYIVAAIVFDLLWVFAASFCAVTPVLEGLSGNDLNALDVSLTLYVLIILLRRANAE